MRTVHQQLALAALDGVHVRSFDGGISYQTFEVDNSTGVRVVDTDPWWSAYLDDNALAVWEFERVHKGLIPWCPGKTVIAAAMPDTLKTEGVNELIAHYWGVWSSAGVLRNPGLPEIVRSQFNWAFDWTKRFVTEVAGIELFDRSEYEKMVERFDREDLETALRGADDGLFAFSSDFMAVKCVYPKRVSYHAFIYDHGVIRCTCEWKRFHPRTPCKHEIVRQQRIENNEQQQRQ